MKTQVTWWQALIGIAVVVVIVVGGILYFRGHKGNMSPKYDVKGGPEKEEMMNMPAAGGGPQGEEEPGQEGPQ